MLTVPIESYYNGHNLKTCLQETGVKQEVRILLVPVLMALMFIVALGCGDQAASREETIIFELPG